MKKRITLLVLALIAATLFSTTIALSQAENSSEATFYVH